MKKNKPKHSWRYRIAATLFVYDLALMVAAALASFVPPYAFWWLALAGLGFPYVLLVTILFALYFLATKHFKTFGITFIVIAVTLPVWSHYFAYGKGVKKFSSHNRPVKLMTWNVRNFDLYNWSHNKETRHKMLSLIKKEDPDILCLQEFFTHDGDTAFDNISALKKLGFHYHHFNNGFTLRKKEHWGNAIFSKYLIESKGEIQFTTSPRVNGCIYDNIHIRDTTIRVFNVHLQSIYLDDSDYASIDHPHPQNQTSRHKLWRVALKLDKAFVKRARQADTVRSAIAHSPYAVIVCGDFNDTPASYTYHTIGGNLTDAFLQAGFGMGKTYTGPVPSFRIDYTLCNPLFKVLSYNTIHKKYSDHYPVVTVIGW